MPPRSEEPPPSATRIPLWAWPAIVVVAVGLRAWFASSPWGLAQDSITFLELAQRIGDGAYFDGWTLRMLHPGYPALIAAVGAVVGDLELAARLTSGLASVATVVLAMGWWARRGHRDEAVLLGTVLAVHSGSVIFGQDVYVEATWLLLVAVAFALAARQPTLRTGLGAGLALGLAAVVKTTALYFTPGFAAIVLWEWRRQLPFLHRMRWLTVVGVVTAVCVAPFLVHGEMVARAVTGMGDMARNNAVAHATGQMWSEHIAGDPLRTTADGTVSNLDLWTYSLRALVQVYLPKTLYPWFLVVPTALLGAVALVRRDDATGRWWRIAAVAVSVELVLMCTVKIESRYVLPALLVALPAVVVGVVDLHARARRIRADLPRRVLLLAPWGLGLLLAAAWLYGVGATGLRNQSHENGYRDAGRWLARERPDLMSILSMNREVAWRAGAERAAPPPGPMGDLLELSDATILVVGPSEIGRVEDSAALPELEVGAEHQGWRLVHRNRTVSLFERSELGGTPPSEPDSSNSPERSR